MIFSRTSGRRAYQKQALVAVRKERLITLFWARRARKSTTIGDIAFDEMSKAAGRTVIAASASLLVGSELVSMAVTAAEQAARVTREAMAMQSVMMSGAEEAKLDLQCADTTTGKVYGPLNGEQFAELYSTKRLEMRLHHDRTNYSRLLVIAPNPATARGWGGVVLRDEAAFTPASLETELQIAVDPIFRDDPSFKMIYASNLSRDDRHPFFERTMPPPGMEFTANPNGHFYRGTDGGLIHRVSLSDAYAAGHVLYDNRGEPMTLQQFRSDPANKLQLPWNYDLVHQAGGTAAIDFVALQSAQMRGARECAFAFVDDEADFQEALSMLRVHLGDSPVGIGFDVATTTKETSNPSAVTVTEKRGIERLQRLVVVWKERKPQIVRERLKQIIRTIGDRLRGGRARRLCIDATNERYFAEETADALRAMIPVELVISSVNVQPPGYTEPTNFKTWLGDIYSTAVNDNHYALPSSEYVKQDHRLPVKNAGRYDATPDQDGKHGDTFDSGKLAEYAVQGSGNFAYEQVEVPGHEEPLGRGGLLL